MSLSYVKDFKNECQVSSLQTFIYNLQLRAGPYFKNSLVLYDCKPVLYQVQHYFVTQKTESVVLSVLPVSEPREVSHGALVKKSLKVNGF